MPAKGVRNRCLSYRPRILNRRTARFKTVTSPPETTLSLYLTPASAPGKRAFFRERALRRVVLECRRTSGMGPHPLQPARPPAWTERLRRCQGAPACRRVDSRQGASPRLPSARRHRHRAAKLRVRTPGSSRNAHRYRRKAARDVRNCAVARDSTCSARHQQSARLVARKEPAAPAVRSTRRIDFPTRVRDAERR